MSVYYPVCPHRPCPVCGDTSGSCEISEYGYALVCYGMPLAQEGDLEGMWKCFGATGEYSQWEDQRVSVVVVVKAELPANLTLRALGEEPIEISQGASGAFDRFIEKLFRQAAKRHEGEGGEV